MNLPSSSGERHGTRNRFSFASESTAVTGGPSSFKETSGGKDGFGRTSSFLIYGTSIDWQPERFVGEILEGERKTYVRSESPQSYDSGPHSFPSFYSTFQDTAGVGIMMDRSRHRRIYTTTRRTGLGFSAARPSLVSRASSGALFALRGDAPTALPNSAIGSESPYGSFDLSEDGQLGAAHTFEE